MSHRENSPTRTLVTYLEQMGSGFNPDDLREMFRETAQLLMELEVSAAIEAGHYERSGRRTAYRNGYRRRMWHTHFGAIPLDIPKLRKGTYYPAFMGAPRESGQRLIDLIQEAYVEGANVRKVEALLHSLNLPPVHPGQLWRLSHQIETLVQQYRQRPLEHAYPYLWLETLPLSNHRDGALAVALGIGERGGLDLLAFEPVRHASEEGFWTVFLRRLLERGLRDVRLVIGDAPGLSAALLRLGLDWRFCGARSLRHILDDVPEHDHSRVIAAIGRAFVQPTRQAAGQALRHVVDALHGRWPSAASQLALSADALLAEAAFPDDGLHDSNRLLARLEQANTRRADAVRVVGF